MGGIRLKIARDARAEVQSRIVAWVERQPGTQQAICQRLRISSSQLYALVNDGVERCSLEYLLDVWERCGGHYSLVLSDGSGASSPAKLRESPAPRPSSRP